MPKCQFCDHELPLPSSGIYPPDFECPCCGRPVDTNTLSITPESVDLDIYLIQANSGLGVSIPFGHTIILGRGSYGSPLFQNKAISRKHCIIESSAEGVFICDLGSFNGTWVDDTRVINKTLLHNGAQIRLANELFSLRIALGNPSIEPPTPSALIHSCPNCGYHSSEELTRCPECGFGWK